MSDPAPDQATYSEMTITIHLAAYTYTPPPPTLTISGARNLILDAGNNAGLRITTGPVGATLTKSGVGTLNGGTNGVYTYNFN